MVIGLTLTVVHLFGIPITGTSVNPTRSLGPALIVGWTALGQVWLFILAALVGAAAAAVLHRFVDAEVAPAQQQPARRRSAAGPKVQGTTTRFRLPTLL
jgi:aquaporin Z